MIGNEIHHRTIAIFKNKLRAQTSVNNVLYLNGFLNKSTTISFIGLILQEMGELNI